MAVMIARCVSTISRGGAIDLAKGESDARCAFRVVMITVIGVGEAEIALKISSTLVGEPLTIVRPSWGDNLSGFRTSAVMCMPRAIASERTRDPVRPVAPIRRTPLLDIVLILWVILRVYG